MTLDDTIYTTWRYLRQHAQGTANAFQGRHLFLRGEVPSHDNNNPIGGYFGTEPYTELQQYMQHLFGPLQDNSTYVLLHKTSPQKPTQSLLLLYGHLATKDEYRREGYHCITLQGTFAPLKQTYQYFHQQPLERMNQCTEVVFDWNTDTTQQQRTKYIPSLNDVCKRVYLLETDHNYSTWEKLKIKLQKQNPNAKKIELS